MLRSRAQCSEADGTLKNEDGAVNGESGAATAAYRGPGNHEEGADVGKRDRSHDQASGTNRGGRESGSGNGGAVKDHQASWSDVVAMLVELTSEDIFRTVVGLL